MKINYKRIHIGRRTFKTALAVLISLIIVSLYGATTSKMIFAMLGAMGAMEMTFQKSLESCIAQIVGVLFGVFAGVALSSLPMHPLVCVGIGIIFIIVLYNVFQIRFSPTLPCLMIVTICTTVDIQPFTYAMGMPYCYNHILVLLASVALFYMFRYIKIPRGKVSDIICKIASYSLGVYLLHEQIEVRYLWPSWIGASPEGNVVLMVCRCILSVLFVYAVGTSVDAVRAYIFAIIRKTVHKIRK